MKINKARANGRMRRLKRAAWTWLPAVVACGLALTLAPAAFASGGSCTKGLFSNATVYSCVEVDGSGTYVTEVKASVHWYSTSVLPSGRLHVWGPSGLNFTKTVARTVGTSVDNQVGASWTLGPSLTRGENIRAGIVYGEYEVRKGNKWVPYPSGSRPAQLSVFGAPKRGAPTYRPPKAPAPQKASTPSDDQGKAAPTPATSPSTPTIVSKTLPTSGPLACRDDANPTNEYLTISTLVQYNSATREMTWHAFALDGPDKKAGVRIDLYTNAGVRQASLAGATVKGHLYYPNASSWTTAPGSEMIVFGTFPDGDGCKVVIQSPTSF